MKKLKNFDDFLSESIFDTSGSTRQGEPDDQVLGPVDAIMDKQEPYSSVHLDLEERDETVCVLRFVLGKEEGFTEVAIPVDWVSDWDEHEEGKKASLDKREAAQEIAEQCDEDIQFLVYKFVDDYMKLLKKCVTDIEKLAPTYKDSKKYNI